MHCNAQNEACQEKNEKKQVLKIFNALTLTFGEEVTKKMAKEIKLF